MDKKDIREYFDRLAPQWDDSLVRNERVIAEILDNARIISGVRVLDVACGTGVLVGDYLARGAARVTGIDLSPVMIETARAKFADPRVEFVCGDVEQTAFDTAFDRVVVYNAFPHFPQPAALVEALAKLLPAGGVLTVAHGMSREALNRHHSGSARSVSLGLLHEDELAALFAPWFDVTVKISNEQMYQVAGIKR